MKWRTLGLAWFALIPSQVAVVAGRTTVPDAVILQIQRSMEAGRDDEASQLLAAALARYSGSAGLLNLRGVLHAQHGEFADAQKDFQRAVTLAPRLIPAWKNLARACATNASFEPNCEENAWQHVNRAQPGDVESLFELGRLAEQRGRFAESLRLLGKLPSDKQNDKTVLAIRCADLAGLDRIPEATNAARLLIRTAGFSEADVNFLLPTLGTAEEAPIVAILVEALQTKGDVSPDSLQRLVVAYEHLLRFDDARKLLENLVAAEPNRPQHLFELARLAYRGRDLEGALVYLGHARDLAPNDPQAHFLFGVILAELELPLDARKSLEKAVALDGANPDFQFALGAAILQSRDVSESVACFRRYVSARPTEVKGRFALGVAYFAVADYEDSEREMKSVLQDPKTEAGAAYFLGRIARANDRLDQAAAYLEHSLQVAPDFADAYTELARVRLHQDRLEDAMAAARKALAFDPDNFQANGALQAIYQHQHDPRTEQQAARLRALDEERARKQALMLRSIEVKPY